MTTFPGFTYFGWKNRPDTSTPINATNLQGLEERIVNFALGTTGLVSPEKYGAVMNGTTDDYTAFKELHDAINAGTVKGYYLRGPAKITKELPTITKTVTIKGFPGGYLDLSEVEGKSGQGNQKFGLKIAGERGARVEITANTVLGDFYVAAPGTYADGTFILLADPTTEWDTENKSNPGEILEVGRADGELVGANAAGDEQKEGNNQEPAITSGEKLKNLLTTRNNPINEANEFQIPATGTVELEGGEKFAYTSWEWTKAGERKPGEAVEGTYKSKLSSNGIRFFFATEPEVKSSIKQGAKVSIEPPAGTIPLRTEITHEATFTTANKCTVAPVTPVKGCHVDHLEVRGAKGRVFTNGIQFFYVADSYIDRPIVKDCFRAAISLPGSFRNEVKNVYVENSREVDYGEQGSFGYGIQLSEACQDNVISGGHFLRTKHAVTYGATRVAIGGEGGIPRRNKLSDLTSVSAWGAGFDAHGPAYDVQMTRCHSHMANGAGFDIRCNKVSLKGCTAYRCKGGGVNLGVAFANRGKWEVDVECDVFNSLEGVGISVAGASATIGTTSNFVRIRGTVTGNQKEPAVKVQGNGTGAGEWRQKNVDIDVTCDNCEPTAGKPVILVKECDGVHVRCRGLGTTANRVFCEIVDSSGFVVENGPIGWTAENAGNKAVKVEATAAKTAVKGVVREGPVINLGTGKTTETTVNTELIAVYQAPETSVELKGTTITKVTPA